MNQAMKSAVLIAALLPSSAMALCEVPGDPDCVDLHEDFRGTIDFFATGASFTFNDDADDRPDGLLAVAQVQVPTRKIPARATLKRAYLYFGGSLYADNDGIDMPDQSVELQVPGAADFSPVQGEQLYRSGAIPGFPEVILYTVRADITDLMNNLGGEMTGTYRVRGFDADIFNGVQEHTAANASFSIVLIFEEPRLPPRNIVLFDGLQEVLGSTISLDLSGFIVSEVPSGSLTMYALEGDCNPGPDQCAQGNNLAGLERIQVIGAQPGQTLTLSDPLNPVNDIFNRTINTVDPPLSNVTGTDIDTFDITPVLRTGDTQVTVELTAPRANNGERGELVGLGYVVVGIDVFAPELREDSRIEIRTERGEALDAYFPGDPLRVAMAVSNTGNIPGTEISLVADLPENATNFVVTQTPEGSEVSTDPSAGAFGRGQVRVDGLRVRHGEVNDLVLLVETECPLPEGGTFSMSANVSAPAEGGSAFTMTASVALIARDICGPRFFLFGGGGCNAATPTGSSANAAAWLLGLLLLFVRIRKHGAALLLLGLSSTQVGCGSDTPAFDRPPPIPIGVACPNFDDMIIVPPIRGRLPFCVDRFEASISEGELGNTEQPADAPQGDGSTTVRAMSERFVQPARGLTWFQARAACANAGKRLCTADEWSTVCRGERDATFPYGEAYEAETCNGYDATRDAPVETGAMIVGVPRDDGFFDAFGCVSPNGAYDLSGNVWEWNETGFFENRRRGLAGGSFRSNRTGMRCVTEDNHAEPNIEDDSVGFRCCLNFQP